MIKIKNAVKYYKNLKVLNNVSLNIEKNEIISIIGPSGCGKSTLLRCINGLEKIKSGEIFVNDIEVSAKNSNLTELRQKVGMVFQQFNLFPHLTVKENITLAPKKVKNIKDNEAEITALELLERVRLLDKINKYPSQLSGGQAQRVAIARCLAMKPEILLLDEPTSALDPQMSIEVIDTIKELAEDKMTMVLVSHQMKLVQEISGKIMFMLNGEIIEQNSTGDFLSNPIHSEVKKFLEHSKEGA